MAIVLQWRSSSIKHQRADREVTGSSHAERMVNAKPRHLAGCWHWLAKARDIQQNSYRVKSRSLHVLPAEKGLEGDASVASEESFSHGGIGGGSSIIDLRFARCNVEP
jgi:hypothetical protein